MPLPFGTQLLATAVTATIAGVIGGTLSGVLLGVSATAYWLLQLLFVVLTVGGTAHVGARAAFLPSVISGVTFGFTVLAVRALTGWTDTVDLGDQPGLLPVVTAVCGAALGTIGGAVAAGKAARVGAETPVQSSV